MIKEYTILSRNKKDKYSVILFFEEGLIIPEKCSCTCKFGSFYKFTQKNKNSGNWACKHINEALVKYKNNEPDNIQKEINERRENERKTKPIYPIF